MILISRNQGFVSSDMLVVVGDGAVKSIGNFEGEIKACFSCATIVNGDGCFKFTRGLACCSNNSPINIDRFVIWGFVVQIIIEITEMVFKRGIDQALANFHG